MVKRHLLSSTKTRVVIIGGGFGGLYAAKKLKRSQVDITLVDRRNFHLFQPLLYQVATGGLSPADIASPLRSILKRNRNVSLLMAEVTAIDPNRRCVTTRGRTLEYDYLIVAAGSDNQYYGHDAWRSFAPGLKTIEDALEIRRRIFTAYEFAEQATDPSERKSWLTFVVVGGGPTGVELAGALGEISGHTLKRDFRRIDSSKAQVLLLEQGDRILTAFPPQLSAKAEQHLRTLGVQVRTGVIVKEIAKDEIQVDGDDGAHSIPTRTVLWAAGTRASPPAKWLTKDCPELLDQSGRIIVEPDLSLRSHSEIFVIGDLACYSHQGGRPLPALAPVAMQQGRYVAKAILARLEGNEIKKFRYVDKGALATIGRSRAVGQIGRLNLSGVPAWLAWLFVHLMYLAGFQNRVLVFIQWTWNYVTWDRGARLITGRITPVEKEDE